MRRNLWVSLIAIVSVAVLLLTFVFVKDYHPVLGLDLRGGVSVVLKPNRQVPSSSLNQTDVFGSVVKTASAVPPDITAGGDWTVSVSFSGEGGGKFKDLAAKCVANDPSCPAQPGGSTGALAIVLDGVVQSAPTIQPT